MNKRWWVAVASAGAVLLAGCTSQTAGVPATGAQALGTSQAGTAIAGSTPAGSVTAGSTAGVPTSGSTAAAPTSGVATSETAGTAGKAPRLTLSVISARPLSATGLSRVAAAAEAVLTEQKISATVTSKPPSLLAVASAADPAVIAAALAGARKLSFMPVLGSVPATPAQCRAVPTPTSQCSVAGDNRYKLGPAAVALSGVTATSQVDPNQNGASVVTLSYDSATASAVGKYTAAHIGKMMALSDGRQVITAPLIQSVIRTSSLQISGNWTKAETAAIAGRITLAALRVEIRGG